MDKENLATEYKLDNVVVGPQDMDLSKNKDSYIVRKRAMETNMDLRTDNIVQIYLK